LLSIFVINSEERRGRGMINTKNLTAKYIASTKRVLKEIRVAENQAKIKGHTIRRIINYVKDYVKDAEYYQEKERFEVGLTAIAYCEGLLDALKMLGTVNFEWPKNLKNVGDYNQ
jgi:FAD synthetase